MVFKLSLCIHSFMAGTRFPSFDKHSLVKWDDQVPHESMVMLSIGFKITTRLGLLKNCCCSLLVPLWRQTRLPKIEPQSSNFQMNPTGTAWFPRTISHLCGRRNLQRIQYRHDKCRTWVAIPRISSVTPGMLRTLDRVRIRRPIPLSLRLSISIPLLLCKAFRSPTTGRLVWWKLLVRWSLQCYHWWSDSATRLNHVVETYVKQNTCLYLSCT